MPIIGFGQACNYGGVNDASEICLFYQGNEFNSDKNADIALDKILSVTGMSKRFVLKQCSGISNCIATSYKGIRYILYDKDFMDDIALNTNSWSNLSILAHEIGHHVNGHSLDMIVYASEAVAPPTLSESREMELQADEYSGFIMAKLGATLYEAQEAVRLICNNEDDTYSTHPKLSKRLAAIEVGYNRGKGQSSNNNYSIDNSKDAEYYFYEAYNSKDPQYQIENYTKCLRIDPNYFPEYVYNNRGVSYKKLEKYYEAINEYTKAIRINPEFEDAYHNRGRAYRKLEKYYDAIDDYTMAIRINPDYAGAYINRGVAYYYLERYYDAIDDYTMAIRINPKGSLAYNNRGIAKKNLGLPGCDDFSKACDRGDCELYKKYDCKSNYEPNRNYDYIPQTTE